MFTSLDELYVPAGTCIIYAEGPDIARNRNSLVRQMKGEWLWMMDDDHRFGPDLLLALLNHEQDIVVPTVCVRGQPFDPVLYEVVSQDSTLDKKYSWAELSSKSGLIPVAGAGTAGMLIQHYVLADTPPPWFETTRYLSEDLTFCVNTSNRGYQVYADLDQTMTHITPCELEPKRDENGAWGMTITIDGYKIVLEPNAATQTWGVQNNA